MHNFWNVVFAMPRQYWRGLDDPHKAHKKRHV